MVLAGLTDSCNVMVCLEELVHNNTQLTHCRFRLSPLNSYLDKVHIRHKAVFGTNYNNKKICLVLIQFESMLLCTIQHSPSLRQNWTFALAYWRSWLESNLNEIYSWMSSAKIWYSRLWRLKISAIGDEYSTCSKGPKTDPWGTPHFKDRRVDLLPSTWTNCFRDVKYDLNQVGRSFNTKAMRRSWWQYRVVYCVQGNREVQKKQYHWLIFINNTQDVILYLDKISLCRMEEPVGRLQRFNQMIGCNIIC